MFYNLRIAFRSLSKNRLYSVISITGLAVSLAACSFILLWVQDEKSYDRFHKDASRIYQAIVHFKGDGGVESGDSAPGLFATTAEQDFSQVESYCRINKRSVSALKVGDIKLDQRDVLYVDSTFFSFFNFPVVNSSTQEFLQASDAVIISESLALELFGNENPVGRMIRIGEGDDVRVSAVMKDMPHNTTLPCADMICLLGKLTKEEMEAFGFDILNSWGSCEFNTYLRLKPGTDAGALAKAITARQTEWKDVRFFTLQPLLDRHLYNLDGTPAGMKTVRIFQWVALIILCIACINYVNLITARSSRRQQEIVLRKTLGARRKRLFMQLIGEAFILFLFAFLFAVILNIILLPGFNHLSGKEFSISQWTDKNSWHIYGMMLLSVVLMAGLYPAWMLASFKSMKKIQGQKRGGVLRKSLVVLQFVSSVVLIIITIAMQAQMSYIRKKDLGFDREYVFTCDMNTMNRHYGAVKAELLKNTAIREVACATEDVVDIADGHQVTDWQGKQGDGSFSHGRLMVDSSFFSTMRMTFVEGGSFTPGVKEPFIVNETAVKAMGMEKPVVGKWMVASGGIRGMIVGVVKDFHFMDLHKEIGPIVIRKNIVGSLYVRTTAKDASKAIAAVEKLWKQYNPDKPFVYNFLDDTFNRMYKSDIRFGQLFGIFSLIAVLISCLGLFGLITYTAEAKTKEIGIRKVLGASVGNIVNMLSGEFLILVGISMLIAFPLAYYWLDKMLQEYAYRIGIGWWIFATAGLITIILTLITVGWQAVKAATANPVNAIKTE